MRARAKPEEQASSLLCCVDGCTKRWTSDFGRRVCSDHLHGAGATKPLPLPLPTREAARPHSEPAERDDQVDF